MLSCSDAKFNSRNHWHVKLIEWFLIVVQGYFWHVVHAYVVGVQVLDARNPGHVPRSQPFRKGIRVYLEDRVFVSRDTHVRDTPALMVHMSRFDHSIIAPPSHRVDQTWFLLGFDLYKCLRNQIKSHSRLYILVTKYRKRFERYLIHVSWWTCRMIRIYIYIHIYSNRIIYFLIVVEINNKS